MDPFISGLLNVLLDRMASNEVRDILTGSDLIGRQMKTLRTQMLVVNKVIDDAEQRKMLEPSVKTWVDDIKDASYDVEDLLDEIQTECLKKKVDTQSRIQGIGQFLSSVAASLVPFHDNLDRKIKNISSRFEEFARQIDVLGLKCSKPRQMSSRRLPTSSLVDEMRVHGRDSEKEQILYYLRNYSAEDFQEDMLTKDGTDIAPAKAHILVIAIDGLPGIGKSTLAQLVFNDTRIRDIFELKSWVSVSEVFDIFGITRSIRLNLRNCHVSNKDQFHDQSNGSMHALLTDKDLDLLQNKLREKIARKKVLVVLDDVWNENFNNWKTLLLPFNVAASGSTIIVTTRNTPVIDMMRPNMRVRLNELSFEHCWRIFRDDVPIDANLEPIGKDIVTKCRGLPLAVRTLGGVLRSNSNVEYWETILKSKLWELPKENNDLLPGLLLSYDYLPFHLKRCFAYCSIFPKNYRFEENELVLLWMAEGFIQMSRYDAEIEEVGRGYFRELLSRSFFQRSPNSPFHMMHDLIHDLSLYINEEFSSMIGARELGVIPRRTRHFSFIQTKYNGRNIVRAVGKANHLRTFLPLNGIPPCYLSVKEMEALFAMFGYLRVLCLSDYNITGIPNSIGNLKHLRYLDLSNTWISELPDSVCELYNLEVLVLKGCGYLSFLPLSLWKLLSLRHLDLRGTKLTKMPKHMSSLHSLQTLTTFVVGKGGASLSALNDFSQLRQSLCVSQLQYATSDNDALLANLGNKQYLDDLALEWGNDKRNAPEKERLVLGELSPHINLKSLKIKNYGGIIFPNWTGSSKYENITSMHLMSCSQCIDLPSLGELSCLKVLCIENFDKLVRVGEEFYGNCYSRTPSFKSLNRLSFLGLKQWKSWIVNDAQHRAFLNLKEMYLHDCPQLVRGLPSTLPSLQTFEIKNCQELIAPLPRLPNINKLSLSNCGKVDLTIIAEFSSLISLELNFKTESLSAAPDLRHLHDLKELTADGYDKFHNFQGMNIPESIESLSMSSSRTRSTGSPSLSYYCTRSIISPSRSSSDSKGHQLQLPSIPESVKSISICGFQEIATSMDKCTSLQYLLIHDSYQLQELPRGCFERLNYLEIRDVSDFEHFNLMEEDDELGFASLHDLSIANCIKLDGFPRGLNAPNLTTLSIINCRYFRRLPEGMHDSLVSLLFLSIKECPLFYSFPQRDMPPSLLSLLIKDCRILRTLPEGHSLQSLQSLSLAGCPKLEPFPDGHFPPNLKRLYVNRCTALLSRQKEWQLMQLFSLEILHIEGCKDTEIFPEKDTLPNSLASLSICSFTNLECLDCEELENLRNLRELHICECPALRSLSGNVIPSFICSLQIENCPLSKSSS